MTDVETYETVKSSTVSSAVASYVYLNALATKDIVLADKSGSHHKPDHPLAQFETKFHAEHKPAKGEKYTYSKITSTEDEATGAIITNREIAPVRKFYTKDTADLKHFLEFFLVNLCKEYSAFYPTQKGKLEPVASFEKKLSEYVEKQFTGTVSRFIFTIGNTARVDTMGGETVVTPDMVIMKEMEGYYGTQQNRPIEHLRAIAAAYLKFCKLVAIFLANNLTEAWSTITVGDLLAILRHFNSLQRAEGNGALLNNCVFEELTIYVKSRHVVKTKKGKDDSDGMQDDLTEEITGKKPTPPKAKPSATKGGKRGAGKKSAGKKSTTKPAAAPAEDDFEDSANGVDDLDELDV